MYIICIHTHTIFRHTHLNRKTIPVSMSSWLWNSNESTEASRTLQKHLFSLTSNTMGGDGEPSLNPGVLTELESNLLIEKRVPMDRFRCLQMHLGVYCYLLHSSALYLKFPFQVHPMHGFCYNVCSRWANLACGNGTLHILLALTVSKSFSWIEMPNWRIQERKHSFALFKISSQIWQILLISSIKLSLFWQTKFDTPAIFG